MGMAVSFDIREPAPAVGAMDDVLRCLHHVDTTFSTYRDDSEITRFARGELGIDELSCDAQEILLRCLELTELTGGAFDAFAVPAPNGTHLDPSGLVKGWSIERAAATLEAAGARNFCINAGGDIAVRGQASPGRAWRVGVRHPDLADQLALVLAVPVRSESQHLRRMSAARTSLTHASAHRPRNSSSATIVGPDLGVADAYATAAFVMGLDSIDWIETQPHYHAYLITHDGATYWSSRFPHQTR